MELPAMPIEEVWAEYRGALKAFLHKRVGDPDEVEDLLQEILIKTHDNLPNLRSGTSLKPWLYRIAKNAVADAYRRKMRAPDPHPEDLWYGTEEPQVLRDFEPCIVSFLSGLPPEKAELLRAVDLDGRSQRAVAEGLGISYSTLKSQVQTARRDLRRLFDQCCTLSIDTTGAVMDYAPKADRCRNC